MIPNQWYVLMESKQVKDRPVGVTRMGEKMVFWRDGSGVASCLRDRCPHRGVELSKGQVVDGHIQCPFHGFEYDWTELTILLLPACTGHRQSFLSPLPPASSRRPLAR